MSWLTRSGGVGLDPVAGLGDPLDPHLRDPGPVRLGQLPAQVAVLVPQGPVKVAVCTICPNMPAAGIWLLPWTDAAAWRRPTMSGRRTKGTNRDFDGALPGPPR
jgi:hypothetical protein